MSTSVAWGGGEGTMRACKRFSSAADSARAADPHLVERLPVEACAAERAADVDAAVEHLVKSLAGERRVRTEREQEQRLRLIDHL